MKNKFKRLIAAFLCVVMAVSLIACAQDTPNSESSNNEAPATSAVQNEAQPTEAPERGKITVNMGRQILSSAVLPEGATWEDNAYTRMAEEELNIDIVDEFEADGEDYTRQVSLAIAAGEIPDIMKVTTRSELVELYENDLIADLSDVYAAYASDELKAIYDTYGGRAIDEVTIDGQMLAIPATGGSAFPGLAWIRSDWLEKCGITIDEDGNGCITIDEVKMVAETFIKENPENAEKMVGIASVSSLTSSTPDANYRINPLAYALGATPRTWYEENGKLVYGSTTEAMKDTLALLADWYKEGIIDEQLGTRTSSDMKSMLINGELGIFFGTWHVPDWYLNSVYEANPNACYKAYAIEDENGKVNCAHIKATTGYMVVSKEFSNPEIVVELANLFHVDLDTNPEIQAKYPEALAYRTGGVDGSSRPMNIEIVKSESTSYVDIQAALDGKITAEDIKSAEDSSLVPVIKGYLDGDVNALSWSKYLSRMEGLKSWYWLGQNGLLEYVTPAFHDTTPTEETHQANLNKLEEETFIKIVTGALDVETGFAQFVADWEAQGGLKIADEIQEQLN